jgi:molybdenum cofactor synthesis domain-containing protein
MAQATANPTAAMLAIGDEILSGRTRDSNIHHLAQQLTAVGIDLKEVRIVADDPEAIVGSVNGLRAKYTYVFTSGGIGPTHDDITAENVARAFGVPIDIRADARAVLSNHYPNGEADLNPARLRMARVPEGAILIENPVSGAPGFSIGNVHVMAGVPKVFEAMVAGLLPRLETGLAITSASVRVERPESVVAPALGELAREYPDLSIGSYPYYGSGGYGTNLVVRGTDPARVAEAEAALIRAFRDV